MKLFLIIILLTIPLFCFSQQKGDRVSDECQLGREKAEKAILNESILSYYTFGLMMPTHKDNAINSIQDSILLEKYGVTESYLGCVVEESKICYNEVIFEFLEEKYGFNIFDSSYHNAQLIYWESISSDSYNEIVELPDVVAEFPGGVDSLMSYLSQNIKLDSSLSFLSGKRYIQFTIEKDGSVSDCSMIKSPDDVLNNYLFDVMKKMPLWKPAEISNGVKVRVRFVLPINIED